MHTEQLRPRVALILGAIAVACIVFLWSGQFAEAQTLGPNLVANPSLETTDSSGLPTGWKKGGYGTNTRSYAFPVAGHTGNAAQVTLANRTSGDVKWYFNNISVTAGQKYQFSDYYKSTVATEVDIEYTMSNGSKTYAVLGRPGASSGFVNFAAQFTVPANVVSLTVFHLIYQNGSITIDDGSLNSVTAEEPDASITAESVSASAQSEHWEGNHFYFGAFHIKFKVTAIGGDVYLDKTFVVSMSTSSVPLGGNRVAVINAEDGSLVNTDLGGAYQLLLASPYDANGAEELLHTFHIPKDKTAEFSADVRSFEPAVQARAFLYGLEWGLSDSPTGTHVYTKDMGIYRREMTPYSTGIVYTSYDGAFCRAPN